MIFDDYLWVNIGHMKQLDSLWCHLMPEVRREKAPQITTNPISSESWKDLGFQGIKSIY